jgi:hypothetical protein
MVKAEQDHRPEIVQKPVVILPEAIVLGLTWLTALINGLERGPSSDTKVE